MNKKDWYVVYSPLILTWAADQLTKAWASNLESPINLGFMHFMLEFNASSKLAFFSELPESLNMISTCTAGIFLACIYFFIQYILPSRSLGFRSGLSIFLGGVLGNVTDWISIGQVVDFIGPGPAGSGMFAFNLADIFQWIGLLMIVYGLIHKDKLFGRPHNLRKSNWVNPKFQMKYCLFLLSVGATMGLVTMTFSYLYLRVVVRSLTGDDPEAMERFTFPFAITFGLICVGISAALFLVGKILSHKVAGPIYAFEKFTNELMEGKADRDLKLRSQDEFKNLEDLAARLKARLTSST